MGYLYGTHINETATMVYQCTLRKWSLKRKYRFLGVIFMFVQWKRADSSLLETQMGLDKVCATKVATGR